MEQYVMLVSEKVDKNTGMTTCTYSDGSSIIYDIYGKIVGRVKA